MQAQSQSYACAQTSVTPPYAAEMLGCVKHWFQFHHYSRAILPDGRVFLNKNMFFRGGQAGDILVRKGKRKYESTDVSGHSYRPLGNDNVISMFVAGRFRWRTGVDDVLKFLFFWAFVHLLLIRVGGMCYYLFEDIRSFQMELSINCGTHENKYFVMGKQPIIGVLFGVYHLWTNPNAWLLGTLDNISN